MIGRIATFSEVNYLMTLDMGTQSQMTVAQTQEASGQKSLTYGGLGEDVGKVLDLQNQITSLTADGTDATQALSGMQETYSVLGSVTTLGASMLSTLTGYMSTSTTATSTIASSAKTWLTELTSLANTQFGGSYLFSGTSATTAPVDTTSSSYTPATDGSDTGYYQGASTGTSYTGSDGYTVPTSVQADNPGFAKLFNALSLIASAASSSTTSSTALSSALSTASSLIQTGDTELAETQATVSSNTAALTSYQTNASDKATTLQTLATTLTGSDIATATVQVTTLQTQLEASYQTVTKLMSASLAQYLS
jgi:flagellar hook-associated protein 3 FlgL